MEETVFLLICFGSVQILTELLDENNSVVHTIQWIRLYSILVAVCLLRYRHGRDKQERKNANFSARGRRVVNQQIQEVEIWINNNRDKKRERERLFEFRLFAYFT